MARWAFRCNQDLCMTKDSWEDAYIRIESWQIEGGLHFIFCFYLLYSVFIIRPSQPSPVAIRNFPAIDLPVQVPL
jgi:hypothetical protein